MSDEKKGLDLGDVKVGEWIVDAAGDVVQRTADGWAFLYRDGGESSMETIRESTIELPIVRLPMPSPTEPPPIDVNLNAIVKFQLSEEGREAWRKGRERGLGMSIEDAERVLDVKIDLNPTEEILWEVMRTLGPSMRMSAAHFIGNTIRIEPNNGCVRLAEPGTDITVLTEARESAARLAHERDKMARAIREACDEVEQPAVDDFAMDADRQTAARMGLNLRTKDDGTVTLSKKGRGIRIPADRLRVALDAMRLQRDIDGGNVEVVKATLGFSDISTREADGLVQLTGPRGHQMACEPHTLRAVAAGVKFVLNDQRPSEFEDIGQPSRQRDARIARLTRERDEALAILRRLANIVGLGDDDTIQTLGAAIEAKVEGLRSAADAYESNAKALGVDGAGVPHDVIDRIAQMESSMVAPSEAAQMICSTLGLGWTHGWKAETIASRLSRAVDRVEDMVKARGVLMDALRGVIDRDVFASMSPADLSTSWLAERIATEWREAHEDAKSATDTESIHQAMTTIATLAADETAKRIEAALAERLRTDGGEALAALRFLALDTGTEALPNASAADLRDAINATFGDLIDMRESRQAERNEIQAALVHLANRVGGPALVQDDPFAYQIDQLTRSVVDRLGRYAAATDAFRSVAGATRRPNETWHSANSRALDAIKQAQDDRDTLLGGMRRINEAVGGCSDTRATGTIDELITDTIDVVDVNTAEIKTLRDAVDRYNDLRAGLRGIVGGAGHNDRDDVMAERLKALVEAYRDGISKGAAQNMALLHGLRQINEAVEGRPDTRAGDDIDALICDTLVEAKKGALAFSIINSLIDGFGGDDTDLLNIDDPRCYDRLHDWLTEMMRTGGQDATIQAMRDHADALIGESEGWATTEGARSEYRAMARGIRQACEEVEQAPIEELAANLAAAHAVEPAEARAVIEAGLEAFRGEQSPLHMAATMAERMLSRVISHLGGDEPDPGMPEVNEVGNVWHALSSALGHEAVSAREVGICRVVQVEPIEYDPAVTMPTVEGDHAIVRAVEIFRHLPARMEYKDGNVYTRIETAVDTEDVSVTGQWRSEAGRVVRAMVWCHAHVWYASASGHWCSLGHVIEPEIDAKSIMTYLMMGGMREAGR